MCGIAGIVHWGRCADAAQRTARMATSLAHRGPDDAGQWSDASVSLGHTRLAILDITGGRQPMLDDPEHPRAAVVFNGEIYNHRELRRDLEKAGHVFASAHSDTEVLVRGYVEWGEGLVERLNGMFAFAVWDLEDRTLLLARDRFGVKPLYVGSAPGTLLFASEVRALHASGLVERRADHAGVLEYFSFQNLLGEQTPFAGVSQFPAGHVERLSVGGRRRRRYWDLRFRRDSGLGLADAAERHREILVDVMRRQMDADVPVRSYLSGGIDSAAITALARRFDPAAVAYSCLFQLDAVGADREVDERRFSRSLAHYLGVKQVELELAPDAMEESLDLTLSALEYPRMGMSYPNYLIARRVAADAKVVLSGTGGDELHGGYLYRYQLLRPIRRGLREQLRYAARRLLGRRVQGPEPLLRSLLRLPVTGSAWPEAFDPEFLASASFSPEERIDALLGECPSSHPWDRLMFVDARAYLHGLLVLEDKLSMAHSLETRVPLLDNELVDFVLGLPWALLCDGQRGKIVFREAVRPWVPDEIYRKPKMGFGPPDASWYRGPLRGWIEARLAPQRVRRRGVLRPEFVSRVLAEHAAGERNHVAMIWSLLSFDSWCSLSGSYGGRLS